MKLSSIFLVLAIAAGVPSHASAELINPKEALLGTWSLVLTFSDGSEVDSTLSVLPGRKAGEGSVIHAAVASLLLPSPTTAEQGAWEYAGGREFIASYFGYAVDSTFTQPAGRIGFRQRIVVSANGERFNGVATFEVKDVTGAVVFTDQVRVKGTRRHPVAP